MKWLQETPWLLLILGTATLGMAPFTPEPHLIEKIGLLLDGSLSRPIDIFDLFLHGIFPSLLILKVLTLASTDKSADGD